jgi:hypothetical protein
MTSTGSQHEPWAGHAAHWAHEHAEEAADYAFHGGGDAPGRLAESLGRFGLVAYGVVHLLVAGLGLQLAAGEEPIEVDQYGAVAAVASIGPLGLLLLVVFVAGLLAFAAWQVCAAAIGFRWVSGGERFRKRVGAVAKTIAVLAVAVVAVRVVVGDPSTGRAGPQLLVTWLLALPGGRLLVAAVALTVLVIAGSMVYTGLARTFLGDLVTDLPAGVRRTAEILGAFGNLARALAFGAVGVLFGVAALRDDPAGVGGFDAALRALSSQWQGVAPLLVVSAGFAAFGVYCLIDARYRRAGGLDRGTAPPGR